MNCGLFFFLPVPYNAIQLKKNGKEKIHKAELPCYQCLGFLLKLHLSSALAME